MAESWSRTGPHVVLVGGHSGSGKTALGHALAGETGWAWLDQDMLRSVVECALEGLGEAPTSPDYARLRACEVESLLQTAEEHAAGGRSVIVTAEFVPEFADRAWSAAAVARFRGLGARVQVVWVACDADTMRSNLSRRGAGRDVGKLGDWVSYAASVDFGFRPVVEHRLVDGSSSGRPLQWQARELARAVRGC